VETTKHSAMEQLLAIPKLILRRACSTDRNYGTTWIKYSFLQIQSWCFLISSCIMEDPECKIIPLLN